ncbi:MAG: aspartate aminotransferase family protein [Pseudomonadales bacterium]|nr:aspartate aminotransferase family protein [Pseudomonadales bacterium]MCP5185908.1 aspartate aminotransferase family protein [Pseudomonadales bacterium]
MTERHWPFLPSRNVAIDRAEGVYLVTRDGQRILDAAGGAIVGNIGYGRQRVADAVYRATLDTTYVVPPWLTPSREALLGALDNWLPESLTRVHVTSGGSEANEAAMKMAVQYQAAIGEPTRSRIIHRDLSYHGTTLATTAVSGHEGRRRGLERALTPYPVTPTPYPLRCPLGSHHADCGAFYVEALRATIQREGAETIAAFLAEPITGSSGGALVPPDDYWPAVRAMCDEFGILLIMDEVMTGFGRTGRDFACQHWSVLPDILVSGKGLAGGYAPLGGVFATEQVGSALQDAGFGVMFNTFGAHPAACAAAAEVLSILREEDLVTRAAAAGETLSRLLEDAFADHPRVVECRGRGLLQAIEVVQDVETLEPFPQADNVTARIVGKALGKGVFFYGGGTGSVRDIVCMGPPFIITDAELETLVAVLRESVDEVTR